MGRGIVEPVDDFRDSNPPSNPALLDALTADFVANGYRLKPLVALIMKSRTYQLGAEPNETNADDEINFSHAVGPAPARRGPARRDRPGPRHGRTVRRRARGDRGRPDCPAPAWAARSSRSSASPIAC